MLLSSQSAQPDLEYHILQRCGVLWRSNSSLGSRNRRFVIRHFCSVNTSLFFCLFTVVVVVVLLFFFCPSYQGCTKVVVPAAAELVVCSCKDWNRRWCSSACSCRDWDRRYAFKRKKQGQMQMTKKTYFFNFMYDLSYESGECFCYNFVMNFRLCLYIIRKIITKLF